ncbi:MAG TPA: hypothetical protein VFW98_16680 [Gemmatimonadaceae bacterium]|nr:hypothetical protein [Gemmatimonadaceae bacterium]
MLALVAAGTLGLAACQEDLNGGAACPSLCPEQGLSFKDTVLTGVIDTAVTVRGFPPLGSATQLLMVNTIQGDDTLLTVAVARFDSLKSTYTSVDSAGVTLTLAQFPAGQDTVFVPGDSLSVRVYNVDTTADVFNTAAIAALIRPDRLLPGAVATIARDTLDSASFALRIPLPDSLVQRGVVGGKPLRLAFEATTPTQGAVQVDAISGEGGAAPELEYKGRTATDSATVAVPANAAISPGVDIAGLADYMVVVRGTPPSDPRFLAVGGLPASRAYLRFDLPPAIVDSTTVVRASLLLTQVPSRAFLHPDTVAIIPLAGQASNSVTDPAKSALLAAPAGIINLPVLTITPQDSGQRAIELVQLLRLWKASAATGNQRAVILQFGAEGLDPRQVLFYSTDASVPDSLRPRLHLSYIPRASFGLP